ncbi:response regulator transcription factor [Lactobacillus mulieris]|uniref:response regulator transcription factor n=1 Tax=Lactobacillus mulieris TaxID=2508708 RepID=UPI001432D628|nr:response regulator transcription factor [Lactobacillus mulieris]MCF1784183.1 response regulator transcription factor [Lactobacillus mulieris]MCW8104978.1 response regulator transcription factor [Lactobacillus mulieris]MDK6803973.1 response regulator transcription factor [Lactobacillus mulieris]MDK8383101.1 response regulator transcription factor [Lactobacillus mulieris]MDT9621294.1 response regulator transcription factor [Lactobacillus mulieris]
MRILLAEDEKQLNRVLTVAMTSQGYDVDSTFNGQEAVEMAQRKAYDVMIFDIMMPIKDGLTAVKEIRASGDKTYIIMLTAKSEIDDKVRGLDDGADDYLTKPFSLKELLARLRSKERREDSYTTKKVQLANLFLDVENQEVSSRNSVRLSNKETELLQYLLLNKEKKLSTQVIFTHVWKDSDEDEDIVWIYVSYLREKLKAIGADVEISGEKDGSFMLQVKKG